LGDSSVVCYNRCGEIYKLLTNTRQPLHTISDPIYAIYPPYVLCSPNSSSPHSILYKFHYLDPKFILNLSPSWTAADLPPPEHEPALSCHYTDGTPLNLSRVMLTFIQIMTEEQKMEEGKRMFSIFAARMFEQRVLQAYREKVAQERQMQLLRELEDEDKMTKEREQKKQSANQRKKDKKRLVHFFLCSWCQF
jgi:hypothetical protein